MDKGIQIVPNFRYGVTMDEAADLLARDLEDKLLERIVAKYLYYRRGHEFVIVGGCDARHLPNDWPANMDTKVPSKAASRCLSFDFLAADFEHQEG